MQNAWPQLGKQHPCSGRHTSKKMGWENMAGLLRELLWSQSYLWNGFCLLTACDHRSKQSVISPSSQELLGTSSWSSNWQWWLLKNTLMKLHLELATFSCQFSANCVLGRTMEKNLPRISEYDSLGETVSHLLSSSANVNALSLNSNSHQSHCLSPDNGLLCPGKHRKWAFSQRM